MTIDPAARRLRKRRGRFRAVPRLIIPKSTPALDPEEMVRKMPLMVLPEAR